MLAWRGIMGKISFWIFNEYFCVIFDLEGTLVDVKVYAIKPVWIDYRS
ncbi:hypothetical protein SAMN05192566_1573 [Methylophilus rhizosphaerae]|uniref:Uncharacterized protein n=1 Tax=Methylophilus rhizosphaerae TaxID=492660 RepID=A0A1G9CQ46_9PROT|nr:hypothetical protein SAMN05192566_1573 [Methylophilus rhizosphaerae]